MSEILDSLWEDGDCDRNEIGRAVDLLFRGDTVVELRALKARRFKTVSGYFDAGHRRDLVEHAARLSGRAPGVYVTLNPVNPDAMARAQNQAKPHAENTTTDQEILKRAWLPIDFDPKRPAGTSSTDDQHDAAIERAKECRTFLSEQGFPAPILADSGNGAHLLYAIDLPNDAGSTDLIKALLLALAARFSDASVDVDKAVFNAARIWKLYGTLSAKGDDTKDRPHRIAKMLEVPQKLEVASRESLEKVANLSGKANKSADARTVTDDTTFNEIANSGKSSIDVKKWLGDREITITKEKALNGGKLYEVNPCPFNPEHTNGSAYVIQRADGGVSAGCHHNSCSKKGWKDLRDLKEPGWRQKPGEIQPREATEDPDRLARLVLRDRWTHPDGWTLRRFQEQWFVWNGVVYRAVSDEELNTILTQDIKAEFDRKSIEAQVSKDDKHAIARMVTGAVLAGVQNALKSKTHVPSALGCPCWLDGERAWPASEVLVCPNGLFYLPSLADRKDEKLALTPKLFTTFALDFEIRFNAPPPAQWLKFLGDIWEKDHQAIEALQEWMGYCLTQDNGQHKMLVIIGPKRSGKSTIGRVMRALVGTSNATGPTLSSLQGEFGLAQLLGKTLATFSDARLRGQTAIVVERLLSISGEDPLAVPRKYQTSIDVMFSTRLVFLSNELPRMEDASGALIGRMIVLPMERSFYGQENIGLTDELLLELPGILLWAIEGYKRLTQRGHFVQPDSAKPLLAELEELSSPVVAFIRERCVTGVFLKVPRDELHNAYLDWCKATSRRLPESREVFGRNLRAAVPHLGDTQPVVGGERVRYYEGIDLKK